MNPSECKPGHSLRGARVEDLDQVIGILMAAGLPIEDITVEKLQHFLVYDLDGVVRGVVGVESYGASALLRSLAVDAACRSQGIAARLLEGIEKHARQSGVRQLFTLTATAQRYLEKQGYVRIERSQASDAIQAHSQFCGLCPETAVCLSKLLESAPATSRDEDVGQWAAERSAELFDTDFYCAESVLLAIAEALEEDCSAIPRIATGMCSGIARTRGLCGALSGAILGMGLAMGRTGPDESVDSIYQAVRLVRDRFESAFGSSNCHTLTECDLGTDEGQRRFQDEKLCQRCRVYVTRTTEWAMAAIAADQEQTSRRR